MKVNELKGVIKKGDIVVILSLIAVSLIWFSFSFFSFGEAEARIYFDGELQKTILFSQTEGEEIISLGGCEIKVTKDGAQFLSSDCPDGLCVKRGLMKNGGDVMACVPNGVTVEITDSDGHIDGISY